GVTWRVGRATPLNVWKQLPGFQLDADRAGEQLAIVDRFNSVLITPTPGRPGKSLFLRSHEQVSSAALSPDGNLVATGTSRGRDEKVWNVQADRLERELPAEGSAGVAFTPDGTHLLVLESEGVYRSYRVDTWECEWERRDLETGFTRGLRVAIHPS